jgi:hypothetical protein
MDTYLSSMEQKLIRTIIVSNEKKVDVFRIHVFEKSLRFDPHFAYGVSKNELVYDMIMDVERLWIDRKIELSDVFNMMVGVIEKHEKYLEKFYFKPDELDFTGRLFAVKSYSSGDDKNYAYFMCLKNQDKLKRITRKEFESNMKNEEIAKSYVENYSGKDATFFNYRMTGLKDTGKNCYLMIVGDDLKVGFVKN